MFEADNILVRIEEDVQQFRVPKDGDILIAYSTTDGTCIYGEIIYCYIIQL